MNNQELAHNWAHQKKEYQKSSNFYYDGKTIYSYGRHFPIATIFPEKKLVLMTSRKYSNSTSKHIIHTREAIPHNYKIIYLDSIPTENNNIIQNCVCVELAKIEKEYNYFLPKVARARTKNPLENCENMLKNLFDLSEYFEISKENLKLIKLWHKTLNDPKLKELSKKREKEEKEAKEKAEKLRIQNQKDNIKKWLNHEINYLSSDYQYIRPNINNENHIETSLGLSFELNRCKKFFKAIENNQIKNGFVFEAYKVLENNNHHITIGCHKFLKSDFELFNKILNK